MIFHMVNVGMICWDNDGIIYRDIDGYIPSGNDIHSLRHRKWPSRNSGFTH